jgi:hypothetical protein
MRRRQRPRYNPSGVRTRRSRSTRLICLQSDPSMATKKPRVPTGTEACIEHTPRCHPGWPPAGGPLSQVREPTRGSDTRPRGNGGATPAAPTALLRAVRDATPGSIPRPPWSRLLTSRRISDSGLGAYSFRSTSFNVSRLWRSLASNACYVNILALAATDVRGDRRQALVGVELVSTRVRMRCQRRVETSSTPTGLDARRHSWSQ